jgi:putative intracellular protease/amidase
MCSISERSPPPSVGAEGSELVAIQARAVKDEPVVKDKNWIPSRKPEDLAVFSTALIEALRA